MGGSGRSTRVSALLMTEYRSSLDWVAIALSLRLPHLNEILRSNNGEEEGLSLHREIDDYVIRKFVATYHRQAQIPSRVMYSLIYGVSQGMMSVLVLSCF